MKLAIGIAIVSVVVSCASANAQSAAEHPAIVHVDATPGHAIDSFDPDSAPGTDARQRKERNIENPPKIAIHSPFDE